MTKSHWIFPEPEPGSNTIIPKYVESKEGGEDMGMQKHGDKRSAPQPEQKTATKGEDTELVTELDNEDNE